MASGSGDCQCASKKGPLADLQSQAPMSASMASASSASPVMAAEMLGVTSSSVAMGSCSDIRAVPLPGSSSSSCNPAKFARVGASSYFQLAGGAYGR